MISNGNQRLETLGVERLCPSTTHFEKIDVARRCGIARTAMLSGHENKARTIRI